MREIRGNIWLYHSDPRWIIVPTNGSINQKGMCVMGRGLAKQTFQRHPFIAKALGNKIMLSGNLVFAFPKLRMFSFPVKRHWHDSASLKIIHSSCEQVMVLADSYDIKGDGQILLPRVGCGNGGLLWRVVEPILDKMLDNRFLVVDFIVPKQVVQEPW